MALLELHGLTKYYGGLAAVDNVDMSIEKGELRGLIGPNGSGKTTTLNLISGFIKPTRGEIIWKGQRISGKSAEEIVRRGLIRTFQLTRLCKNMTVLQNTMLGNYHKNRWTLWGDLVSTTYVKKSNKAMKEKALALLQLVGLEDIKNERAGDIPHGFQRLLGITIALAGDPELILLDEPLTGMNPVEKQHAMEKISNLHKKGLTIIIVEHDMNAITGYSEKIAVLNFGAKIADGTPKEVTKDKRVIEAYLGQEAIS